MHRHITKGLLLGIVAVLLATLTTIPVAAAVGDAVTVWNANAGVAAVPLVQVHRDGDHALECTRAAKRSGIEDATCDQPIGYLESEALRIRVVAAHESVLVGRLGRAEGRGGEGVKAGDNRRVQLALDPFRQRRGLRRGENT